MGGRNARIKSDDEGGFPSFAIKDAPENRQYTAVESVAETCSQNIDKSTTKNSKSKSTVPGKDKTITKDHDNKHKTKKRKSRQHAHIPYITEVSNNEGGAKHHAVQTATKEQTASMSTENIVIEQNKNAMAVNGNGKNSAEDFKNQATEKKTTVNDNKNINTKDNDTEIKERTQFDKHKAEKERNKELQQLKDQLQERNDKIKQLEKKIKTSELNMNEKNPVRPERNRLEQERDELKTQLDKLEAKNQEQNKELQQQNKELQQLKDQLQKGNDKIKQLKETNTELEEEVKQTQDRCNKTLEGRSNKKMNIKLEREKDELQQKFTEFKRETNKQIEKLNQELYVLAKEKDKALAIKMNELKVVQNEKKDLLLRLSEMTGRRLTDNNANIADLSDQNRPTKLAEKYAELYDNEWTDAFSYLQTLDVFKDAEEKHIIDILLAILVEAFTLSAKTAAKQLDTVRKTLEDFYGKTSHNRDQVQDLIKKLKDQRKKVTQPSMDLEQEYKVTVSRKIKGLPPTSLEAETFKPFVQKCLELCWLMAIQDPPLYLTPENCKTGQKFNRNNFKEYTKSGAYIAFAVWPAVFLEKDGPLLCKGVVQCKKSNSFQLRNTDGSQKGKRHAKSMYYKDTAVTLTSTLSLDTEKCNKSSSLTNASQVDNQSGNTKL